MPWTANVWSWLSNSFNPAVTGTPISSSDWNSSITDLASSLSDVPRFVTAQANAFRFGGVAGGTANALTATLSPAITAYGNGMVIYVTTGASANTGDATLAVNGLAATQVLFYGKALRANDLPASTICTFVYYNSKFHLYKFGAQNIGGWRNILNGNSSFDVWQRGVAGTASIAVPAGTSGGQYTADRWYLATRANEASTVSQQAGISDGSQWCARVQRNNGETGVLAMAFSYPLDTDEVYKMRNQIVSIRFVARAGANWSPASGSLIAHLYTGTGAAPAKRGLTPYTGDVDVTLVTAAVTTTATAFTGATTAVVSASATQAELGFLWTPVGTAGAADYFEIDDVSIEIAPAIFDYERRPFEDELRACQRHYFKTFDLATAPATNAGTNGVLQWKATGTGAVSVGSPRFGYPTRMRAAPTMTTYNPSAANAEVRNSTDGADCTATAASSNESGVVISATGNAGQAVNEDMRVHVTADASI